MNRDIDGGQALDRDFIVSLYNSILTEPFQIPPEDGNDLMLTFFNPEIEGTMVLITHSHYISNHNHRLKNILAIACSIAH